MQISQGEGSGELGVGSEVVAGNHGLPTPVSRRSFCFKRQPSTMITPSFTSI